MEEISREEITSYKDLIVWQKAMDLTDEIYRLTRKLPKEELFGLTNQMRRAAVSIPSNIAEGNERDSSREYLHFLHISKGSCSELETQMEICLRQKMLTKEDLTNASDACSQVGKMLNSLIDKIRTKL